MSVALIGVPTDVNSSFARGAAKAPSRIRAQMWSDAGNSYSENGVNLAADGVVVDAGDVELFEDDGDRLRIEAAIAEQLAAGRRALALGGDHSITYPIVRATARQFPTLSIVHFDAHPDLYPILDGNRFSHACPFARILEEAELSLLQIGIRTMTPQQHEVARRYGVRELAPWQIAEARSLLPDGTVYVTVDLDALDPAFAPGVSHREPGGLSVRDVLDTIAAIPGTIIGADVVELNPDRDVDGLTASVAAKLSRELIARMHRDGQSESQAFA
ncbi:MAG TPA: agmatinase [Candidatus Nitrosotalea sp.]|nr:agmatinase [Candidatus Nitrosotalea sp.]